MNHHSSKKIPESKVLKAALKLFSSKGYSGTKMTDIASDIGLSVGALYLRFKSKEDLCLELIIDQTKDFNKLTKKLPEDDPIKALKAYIEANLVFAFKKKQLISLLIKEHDLNFLKPLRKRFFSSQHEIIKNILKSGIKAGVFKPLNVNDTASMIFACIRGATHLKLRFEVGDEKRMGFSLFSLITEGIRKDSK